MRHVINRVSRSNFSALIILIFFDNLWLQFIIKLQAEGTMQLGTFRAKDFSDLTQLSPIDASFVGEGYLFQFFGSCFFSILIIELGILSLIREISGIRILGA